jgi:hypothetical protein
VAGELVFLANKILGPAADEIGQFLRELVAFRLRNLRKIFEAAEQKGAADAPGQVSERVLGRVIEDGSYCPDAVSADYIGGVLTSAKYSDLRDDRGAAWVDLIARLSSFQVRLHYVFYEAMRARVLALSPVDPPINNLIASDFYFSLADLRLALELEEGSGLDAVDIIDHSLGGLAREDLIKDRWSRSMVQAPGEIHGFFRRRVPAPGIAVEPTLTGAELFMYGSGAGHLPVVEFMDPQLELGAIEGVEMPQAVLGNELPSITDPS